MNATRHAELFDGIPLRMWFGNSAGPSLTNPRLLDQRCDFGAADGFGAVVVLAPRTTTPTDKIDPRRQRHPIVTVATDWISE